ncbi:MAG: hypothetical protein ACK5U4_21205, partial [Rhodospirillales bacterium]
MSSSRRFRARSQSKKPPQQSQRLLDFFGDGGDFGTHVGNSIRTGFSEKHLGLYELAGFFASAATSCFPCGKADPSRRNRPMNLAAKLAARAAAGKPVTVGLIGA